jgi:hypothetical protein
MSYISNEDLLFEKNANGILAGGIKVNSILMSQGINPVSTMNTSDDNDNLENINYPSQLFDNLVVPNWIFCKDSQFYNKEGGGKHFDKKIIEEGDDLLDETIHNKLLKLLPTNYNPNKKHTKKKYMKNRNKTTKKNR